MEDLKKFAENLDGEIDKYKTLKWIFDKTHFRYNDELFAFKKKLTESMDYGQLDVFNTLCELIKDNILENVAALACIKIIIDK